jgi:hypothetical protein
MPAQYCCATLTTLWGWHFFVQNEREKSIDLKAVVDDIM